MAEVQGFRTRECSFTTVSSETRGPNLVTGGSLYTGHQGAPGRLVYTSCSPVCHETAGVGPGI